MALATMSLAATAVACGSDPGTGTGGSGGTGAGDATGGMGSGASGGMGTGATGGMGTGGDGAGAPDLTTAAKIETYLAGKTLTMTGADVPSHPNGFDENTNFGQATQCYVSTVMMLMGQTFQVTSELGTLENAPNTGDMGTCNKSMVSNTLMFSSTNHLIENVEGNADCFDFTITYTGFGQEGRGSISADGQTLNLELFFKDQGVGIRCADGAVGSGGVTLNGNAFTGDAVQVYRITE
ncbi:MAG: hypothetical protein R3B72_08960 [Polyangiaceae bacterium]